MGRIILKCPSTGRPLDTGIRLPRHVFEAYRPKNAKTFCHHCNRTHPWTKEAMALDDEDGDSSNRRQSG